MAWEKIKIQRDNGEFVDAQAPVIISASRSTDIPAFSTDLRKVTQLGLTLLMV